MRSFHLGAILSITDGHLVAQNHMDDIYSILNYMTGENLFTHQLVRAYPPCRLALLAQHPDLADVNGDHLDGHPELVEPWLAEQVAKYGECRDVAPLWDGEYKAMNPMAEMWQMLAQRDSKED